LSIFFLMSLVVNFCVMSQRTTLTTHHPPRSLSFPASTFLPPLPSLPPLFFFNFFPLKKTKCGKMMGLPPQETMSGVVNLCVRDLN
jgi:hypothetical protein